MLIRQGGKFYGILRANLKPPVLDDPEPWFHHFSQLLIERRPDAGAPRGEIRARLLRECRAHTAAIPLEAFQALNAPITEGDVRRAMAKAENNKSTADGILMEIYKYAETVVPGTQMVDNWTAVGSKSRAIMLSNLYILGISFDTREHYRGTSVRPCGQCGPT
jgi:hypothetical protein